MNFRVLNLPAGQALQLGSPAREYSMLEQVARDEPFQDWSKGENSVRVVVWLLTFWDHIAVGAVPVCAHTVEV